MHFIPCSRHVLVNKCCKSATLSDGNTNQYRSFAEILSAYVHFKALKNLEQMKQAYAYFSPNEHTPVYPKLSIAEKAQQAQILADTFERILKNANYQELSQKSIEEALNQSSLIPVNTKVNLNEYERIMLFYRGSSTKEVSIKRFFRSKTIVFENYDCVAVLLQIKLKEFFNGNDKSKDQLNFTPGKIYLYLYKNIPHYDLELLFPNVKISMNIRDKAMLIIPALGAAIPMLVKVLPILGLLVGVIAYVVFGMNLGGEFNVDVSNPKAVYPLLVTMLSACVALGGFAARQYIKYKSKRLEFLKKVTDVLFFKSLDICQGVLNAVVDSAEEEQSKEMLLIYHLLLSENKPLSKQQIEQLSAAWVEEQFSLQASINVNSALEQLINLQAPIIENKENESIVKKLPDGRYLACNLKSAKRIVDYVWDNVFQYSNYPTI